MKTKDIKLATGEMLSVSVGDKLYLYNVNRNFRGNNKLRQITVTKIGRRWITFDENYQFDSDGDENSDYGHNRLYKSQQQYDDIILKKKLSQMIAEEIRKDKHELCVVCQIAYLLGVPNES